MSEVYTGFSNYTEINSENRRRAAEKELSLWGGEREKFEKYRLEWNRAANEHYLPPHPLHVDIELSDTCNLRCKMCIHGFAAGPKGGFMEDALALRLIDECAQIGVYSVKFNWRGEATLNKTLPHAIHYAKEKGILEVQINTNGLPPKRNENILRGCAESGIDRIIFSVDGFSRETYESIRVGGDYHRLLKNVHRLLDWKRERQVVKPFIRVQMVRTSINAHEVDDFLRYWQPLVDDVRISDVMNRGQGGTLSVGDQVVVGRRRCPQPFQRLTVGRDGRVSPCCSDWSQEFIVGDTPREGLMDIWKGKEINYLRELHNCQKVDEVPICKKCFVKESYRWKKT